MKFETWVDQVRLLAAKNIQKQPDDVFLRRWWVEKYKRSPKCEEFLEYTISELMLEFFEDVYERDSKQIYELYRRLGESDRLSTDDPLISKWEEQFERGEEPDLMEGIPEALRHQFTDPRSENASLGVKKPQTIAEIVKEMSKLVDE